MPITNRNDLPDYERPPVVETVLGVQFDALAGFTNAHLGAFWKTLEMAEWPSVSDAPPLPPQIEQFSESPKWASGLRIQLAHLPARLQITNAAGDRMIQVQNGRLHFNWLGKTGGDYPRYETIRSGFDMALEKFRVFIAKANVGEFRPIQWEVTYINHILRGTVWNTPNDWVFFKPLRAIPEIENVVQEESFVGEWHFVIPKERGRLHIEWRHGLKAVPEQQGQEIVQLTLTARGPLESKDNAAAAIGGRLDLGHETIVRTFKNLMSNDANRQWGLKDAGN